MSANKLITILCLIAAAISTAALFIWMSGPPVIGGESTALTVLMFSIFTLILYQVIRKI